MGIEMRRVQDELVVSHEINVTPFIDVMLVLLIIFMIAVPLSTVNMPLDLPISNATAQPPPEDPVVLSVANDLTLAVGDRAIGRAALGGALDAATKRNRGTRIFLRADKAVKYGDLMDVMDRLREIGYLKVALVAREAGNPAP
jgi:biopolymer transport protein ExbD